MRKILVWAGLALLPAMAVAAAKQVVLLSIDGLPAAYFTDERSLKQMPNLLEIARRGSIFQPVRSVNPTVTFPAHTSMVTGVTPGVHGINGNHPFEPFRDTYGDWMWYDEDIRVKTLWDFAAENQKTVASLYWPVTVGANIRWNIPQYHRRRNQADIKLLRSLSTGSIYQTLEKKIRVSLHEQSSDSDRLKAAAFTVNHYRANLTLVYTTDLDTVQHSYGAFSPKALQTLQAIDAALGNFIKTIRLYRNKDLILAIVSDHGFREYQGACQPNVWLKQQGYLRPDSGSYDWIFRSHAGLGWFLPSEGNKSSELPAALVSELQANCPDISLVHRGKELERLRRESEPAALGFLLSRGNTILLQNHNDDFIYRSERTFFSHGFNADDPSMATAVVVYPAIKKDKKISAITDIFSVVCSGMNMRCHPGEQRR